MAHVPYSKPSDRSSYDSAAQFDNIIDSEGKFGALQPSRIATLHSDHGSRHLTSRCESPAPKSLSVTYTQLTRILTALSVCVLITSMLQQIAARVIYDFHICSNLHRRRGDFRHWDKDNGVETFVRCSRAGGQVWCISTHHDMNSTRRIMDGMRKVYRVA